MALFTRPPPVLETGLGDTSMVEGDFPEAKVTKFKNVRLLRNHKLELGELWVQSGKVIDPFKRWERARTAGEYAAHRVYDCRGLIMSPGFIDLQINGAFGCDFSSISTDDPQGGLEMVARRLPEHGVTAFCPTVITSTPETYLKILPLLGPRPGGKGRGATVLGVHLEGPFISPEKQGAHPSPLIRSPGDSGFAEVASVYGIDEARASWAPEVAIVTLAPENPGALSAIAGLTARGVVVSAGHSAAGIDDGEAAVKAGVRFVTHLFNAMGPFHHRDPGLVGLLGAPDRVFYSLICDGFHVHPYSVNIVFRVHPDGAVLVTDAIEAMGLPDGQYQLGAVTVDIGGGKALVAGHPETLAGAIAPMNVCVRNFARFTDCDMVDALEAASLHPAQVLGLEGRKGSLCVGADADFVLIDADYNVCETWVAGKRVYPAAPPRDGQSTDIYTSS